MGGLFHNLRHPRHCYAICATARSGSHLLCDGLRSTRRAGRPRRFFHEPLEKRNGDKHGLNPIDDYAGYVRGIVAATATQNGVFGFKIMAWDVARLIAKLRETGEFDSSATAQVELLRKAFPRLQFICLTRCNKLRQAISHARALQTGVWKAGNGAKPATDAKFDQRQITACLESAEIEETIWNDFFARNGIEPLRLTYEELSDHYRPTIEKFLHFLHIRLPRGAMIAQPGTIRQTDALNVEWEDRFRQLKAS